MAVVRLLLPDGMLLSEARELFADLEQAHDTVVAVDALAASFGGRPRRLYLRYLDEFGPGAFIWPGSPGPQKLDLIRAEPSRLLLPRQRMALIRAEMSSPGSFDIGGVGSGIDAVTRALSYRQERREGKKYRDKDRETISNAEAREARARAAEREEQAEQAALKTESARRMEALEKIAFRGHIRDAVESGLLSLEEAAPLLNTSVEALERLQRGVARQLVEGAEPLGSDDADPR